MSREDFYIGGTSIQIGQHGFINQPKEIIEYIKYLQNQLQQKDNIIKEVREYIKENTQWYDELLGIVEMHGYNTDRIPIVFVDELLEILNKGE